MLCPKCGAENEDQASHCASCGVALEGPGKAGAAARMSAEAILVIVLVLVMGVLGLVFFGPILWTLWSFLPWSYRLVLLGVFLCFTAVVWVNFRWRQSLPKGFIIAEILLSIGFVSAISIYLVLESLESREEQPSALCIGNMKQLALAALMYAEDNNGRLPLAENWSDSISPYVKHNLVFVCPEVLTAKSGYAYNQALASRKLSEVSDPASTVMFFESDWGWNGARGVGALLTKPRHKKKIALAFADGHAAWHTREEALQMRWRPK